MLFSYVFSCVFFLCFFYTFSYVVVPCIFLYFCHMLFHLCKPPNYEKNTANTIEKNTGKHIVNSLYVLFFCDVISYIFFSLCFIYALLCVAYECVLWCCQVFYNVFLSCLPMFLPMFIPLCGSYVFTYV